MTYQQLYQNIIRKKSFLCIGLDTDITKIPSFLLQEKDPIFEFNRRIIEATHQLCIAYKPNIAFYEARGAKGWESLQKTLEIIPSDCFTIADAKRGDIGNTSALYARAFFDPEESGLNFDAITVAPYMGEDSVTPFLSYKDKWIILLGLTSNAGSRDFQNLALADNRKSLYEQVLITSQRWGNYENMMYVIGATHPEAFSRIRALIPDHFLLVPGVGAQGGDLEAICNFGLNDKVGLLVNSSRSIIYASKGENFEQEARKEALKLQQQMEKILEQKEII